MSYQMYSKPDQLKSIDMKLNGKKVYKELEKPCQMHTLPVFNVMKLFTAVNNDFL